MAEANKAETTATEPRKTEASAPVKAEAAKAADAPKAQAPTASQPKAEKTPEPAKAASAIVKKSVRAARVAAPAKKRKPARKAAARKTRKPAQRPVVNTNRPVRAGAKQIEQGVKIMNKQTRETVETGFVAAEQFRSVFGDVNERAKTAMERSARIVEEMTDLTRGNVEAIVASSKVAAKGVETLSQDAAEYSRKSFEEASTALKSFAEVKSATDFFRLQGDYARAAFDHAVAESARMSEAMLKIAGDAAQPITSRYTVAAERVKTLAA